MPTTVVQGSEDGRTGYSTKTGTKTGILCSVASHFIVNVLKLSPKVNEFILLNCVQQVAFFNADKSFIKSKEHGSGNTALHMACRHGHFVSLVSVLSTDRNS